MSRFCLASVYVYAKVTPHFDSSVYGFSADSSSCVLFVSMPLSPMMSAPRPGSAQHQGCERLAGSHPQARVVGSFEEAIRGADLVCCCTDAEEPVLSHAWLAPGAHVSSVGVGREVDEATVRAASIFVEWRGAAENPPPTGSAELQGLDPASIAEIGEVFSGAHPGRRSDDELTLYKSTGHAVEDAAAARQVFDRATAEGVGTTFEL